jgi:hypothetical protein
VQRNTPAYVGSGSTTAGSGTSALGLLRLNEQSSGDPLMKSHQCTSGFEQSQQTAQLFNHLVGGSEQFVRHGKADYRGSGGVDDEFELGQLHDWKVGGFRTLQDAANINAGLAVRLAQARPIAHQPAHFGVGSRTGDRGDSVSR